MDLLELPVHVLSGILTSPALASSPVDVLRFGLTCKRAYEVASSEDLVWKPLYEACGWSDAQPAAFHAVSYKHLLLGLVWPCSHLLGDWTSSGVFPNGRLLRVEVRAPQVIGLSIYYRTLNGPPSCHAVFAVLLPPAAADSAPQKLVVSCLKRSQQQLGVGAEDSHPASIIISSDRSSFHLRCQTACNAGLCEAICRHSYAQAYGAAPHHTPGSTSSTPPAEDASSSATGAPAGPASSCMALGSWPELNVRPWDAGLVQMGSILALDTTLAHRQHTPVYTRLHWQQQQQLQERCQRAPLLPQQQLHASPKRTLAPVDQLLEPCTAGPVLSPAPGSPGQQRAAGRLPGGLLELPEDVVLLQGLWKGTYGCHGVELISVSLLPLDHDIDQPAAAKPALMLPHPHCRYQQQQQQQQQLPPAGAGSSHRLLQLPGQPAGPSMPQASSSSSAAQDAAAAAAGATQPPSLAGGVPWWSAALGALDSDLLQLPGPGVAVQPAAAAGTLLPAGAAAAGVPHTPGAANLPHTAATAAGAGAAGMLGGVAAAAGSTAVAGSSSGALTAAAVRQLSSLTSQLRRGVTDWEEVSAPAAQPPSSGGPHHHQRQDHHQQQQHTQSPHHHHHHHQQQQQAQVHHPQQLLLPGTLPGSRPQGTGLSPEDQELLEALMSDGEGTSSAASSDWEDAESDPVVLYEPSLSSDSEAEEAGADASAVPATWLAGDSSGPAAAAASTAAASPGLAAAGGSTTDAAGAAGASPTAGNSSCSSLAPAMTGWGHSMTRSFSGVLLADPFGASARPGPLLWRPAAATTAPAAVAAAAAAGGGAGGGGAPVDVLQGLSRLGLQQDARVRESLHPEFRSGIVLLGSRGATAAALHPGGPSSAAGSPSSLTVPLNQQCEAASSSSNSSSSRLTAAGGAADVLLQQLRGSSYTLVTPPLPAGSSAVANSQPLATASTSPPHLYDPLRSISSPGAAAPPQVTQPASSPPQPPAALAPPALSHTGAGQPPRQRLHWYAVGRKVTGDLNVPAGKVSFVVDISSRSTAHSGEALALPLGYDSDVALHKPGVRRLVERVRYQGRAQLAFHGFERPSVIGAELLLFEDDCFGLLWHGQVQSLSLYVRVHKP